MPNVRRILLTALADTLAAIAGRLRESVRHFGLRP